MCDLGTELTITETTDGFVLGGEIDAHTAPALERALRDFAATHQRIVLDAEGVTFMDSSGLRVLIGVTNDTRDRGGDLVIERPTTVVRRLVEISGLTNHLTLTGEE